MIPDILEYLNGNVPMGLWALPFIGGLFTFVWWFVWHSTRFWDLKRFWRIFAIGWIIILASYTSFWRLNPPQTIPTRVFVRAGDGIGVSPGAWAEGVADIIRARLRAAPEPFVVLDEESAPMLASASTDAELDGFASRIRVKYIVIVTQDSIGTEGRPPVKIAIRSSSGGRYKPLSEFPAPDLSFSTLTTWAAEAVAQQLGGVDLKGRWAGRLPSLPDSVLEVHFLAYTVRRQGEHELAAALFMEEADADTSWSAPRIELARTWLKSTPYQHEEAIRSSLLQAAAIDRENPESYILLGRHFLEFRDWEEAESALKLAYYFDPDDPRTYFYLSRLMENRFADLPLKSSRELIERALHLAPGYETARLGYIEKMRAVYEKRKLTEVVEEGLHIDPHSRSLLVTASALYIQHQKYDMAANRCQVLLERNPRDNEALYNLGLCRLWLKHYDEAIALFDSSRSNGGSVENLYYTGVAYQIQHRDLEAIEWFQKRFAAAKNQSDQGAISSRARILMLKDRILQDSLKKTGWEPPDLFERYDAEKKELLLRKAYRDSTATVTQK